MKNRNVSADLEMRATLLCNSIAKQFYGRAVIEPKKKGLDYNAKLSIERKDNKIWLKFTVDGTQHVLTIPSPHFKRGICLITQNDVSRAVCNYFIREEDLELDYYGVISRVLLDDPTDILPMGMKKGKSPFFQQIVYSFENKNTAIIIHNVQRAINEIVNKFPLHETYKNSFIMNQRLMIIDPEFDEIQDPATRLRYQIEKSIQYFERGWTSIGLADGNLSDKNYILKTDLKQFTPFGNKFHNPQRNLYSTLGMKGDELPIVRSESQQELMNDGITRKGWNLFTLFVDVPDVFEDQIMVDESHRDKFVTATKRYQIFGKVYAEVGESLKYGKIIGRSPDYQPTIFKIRCEKAYIMGIKESTVNVGGVQTKMYNVTVEYRRYFKDGFKFSNMHGNKGIIRMTKLGFAKHPITGELVKIDVIASSKSIKKRKNYGQIYEALINNLNEGRVNIVDRIIASRNGTEAAPSSTIVIPDDYDTPIETLQERLEERGFGKEAKWDCDTCYGDLHGVAGRVFWGVTKTPEDAIWEPGDTTRRNGKDLRVAGLKFSPVEFRAISTRFGKDNPLLDEIMSYSQGSGMLREQLKIVEGMHGNFPEDARVLNLMDIKAVEQPSSTIVPIEDIAGTVVDENFCPEGAVIQLPVVHQIIEDDKGEIIYQGLPLVGDTSWLVNAVATYNVSKIYIPSGDLRRCWRHDTGKYGLSSHGVLINNVIVMAHRFFADQNDFNRKMLHYSIRAYFNRVVGMLGTKRGDISTYGMSVRYPYSAKATAALSNTLPKNTVEIHRSMARQLRVRNGDIVIAERFPCLGFMSVRPQQVRVTDDPMCKYVIRVSGNSLVSQSLDFDGDVEFLAAFHTPEAKAALMKEWSNPNKTCYDVIKELNKKSGIPHIKCMGLSDYDITPFDVLTKETHAILIERATGVKSHTGPVIALAYNLMRIIENSDVRDNQKTNVAIEVFLDKVGNSVFRQKHGVKSLHDIVVEAVCKADDKTLIEHGFKQETTELICNLIRSKARQLRIFDLEKFYEDAKKRGGNLITFIVRNMNKIYFASRAQLDGGKLLKHLDNEAVDIPSRMFKWAMSGNADSIRTPLDKHMEERMLRGVSNETTLTSYGTLMDLLNTVCGVGEVDNNKFSTNGDDILCQK